MKRTSGLLGFTLIMIIAFVLMGCPSPITPPADINAPTLSSTVPADGTSDVDNNNLVTLVLNFSENVTVGTGTIVIRSSSDGSVFDTITAAGLSGSGTSTVTASLNKTLLGLASYYVQISATLFTDAVGNSFAGIADTTSWYFATAADAAAPLLVGTTPADDATGVLSTLPNLTLTFNEDVAINGAAGNIEIHNTGGVVATILPASLTGAGTKSITAPFLEGLPAGDYYVHFPTGLFQDAATNSTLGISDDASWSFSTVNDVEVPVLLSTVPADGATDVSVLTSTLTMTFNKLVKINTGNVTVRRMVDNSILETVAAGSLSASGSTVTIPLTGALVRNVEYYINVGSGLITDKSDNAYTGISDTTTWNFTAFVDTFPPLLNSTVPADNATSVSTATTTLTMVFSEAVSADNSGNPVVIYNAGGSEFESIPASSVSSSGTTVTAMFTGPLVEAHNYYVEIPGNLISDSADNYFAGISGDTAWNFTVQPDTTPPALVSIVPADNATGVSLSTTSLTITFNDVVTINTAGSNIVIYNAGGSVFETIPATALTGGGTAVITVPFQVHTGLVELASYYVNVPGDLFHDNATTPNYFAGISGSTAWNFIAEDVTPPSINVLSPQDNATGVSQTLNSLSITFNENTYIESGNITIRRSADNGLFETIAPASIGGSGTTAITVPISGSFAENTGYYVGIPGTLFRDNVNNYFAGLSGSAAWNFTTGADVTAPVITGLSPADNSTGVPVTTTVFTITFSENIAKGAAGNIVVYKNGAIFDTIDVTSANVAVASNTATIALNKSGLRSASNYYVQIDAGAFTDTAAIPNNHAGISDTTSWNFSSQDGYLLSESFDYGSTAGDLTTQSSGAWTEVTAGTSNVLYNTSSLPTVAETSGGKATGTKNASSPYGQIVKEALSSTVNSGFIYMLVSFSKVTSTTATDAGFGVALLDSSNARVTGMYLSGDSDASGSRYRIYLSTGDQLGIQNAAAHCVLKYDFITQTLYGYLCPPIHGAEPAEAGWAKVTGVSISEIASVSVDQQWMASGSTSITYDTDEIRISRFWTDLQYK